MKALVISEDAQDCDKVSRMIQASFKDIQTVKASNVEEAMSAASVDGPFGFIALDVEAKNFEPDELGKDLLDLAGDRPFLFFGTETIFSDRVSQELFQSNEYNDTFFRPFERDDFKEEFNEKVAGALEFAKKEEFEQSIQEFDPDEFIPMKLRSFYLYNTFPYDIFMEITKTRYIKILSAQKPYTITTLSTYAKKGVRFLHIKKDDQLKYLEEESKKCLKAMRKLPPESNEAILALLRSMTLIHQSLTTIGVTPTVLTLCNALTDNVIEMVKKSNNLPAILKRYPHIYSGIASKSLLTAFISTAISYKMGWDSITTKKKLTMSSILMDFTLMEERMSHINGLNDPLLKELGEEELQNFLDHPSQAAKVAQQFTMYPDIDFLIQNHHETPTRSGFPNKPSHVNLTSLCSVFNTAQFLAANLDGQESSSRLLAKSFKSLSRDYNAGNFKEAMRAAKKAFRL